MSVLLVLAVDGIARASGRGAEPPGGEFTPLEVVATVQEPWKRACWPADAAHALPKFGRGPCNRQRLIGPGRIGDGLGAGELRCRQTAPFRGAAEGSPLGEM